MTLISCQDSQESQYKAKYDVLSGAYSEVLNENTALHNKVTGLNQEVEQLTISLVANKLYTDDLERRYLSSEVDYIQALSYIDMAEFILSKQGIEYRYVGRR